MSQYSAFQTAGEGISGSRGAAAHRRAAESSFTGNDLEIKRFTECRKIKSSVRVEEFIRRI